MIAGRMSGRIVSRAANGMASRAGGRGSWADMEARWMAAPRKLTQQQEAFRSCLNRNGVPDTQSAVCASLLSSTQSPLSFEPPPHLPEGSAALWQRIKRDFLSGSPQDHGEAVKAGIRAPAKAHLDASSYAAIEALQAAVPTHLKDASLELSGVHRRLAASSAVAAEKRQPVSLLLIVPLASAGEGHAVGSPGGAADMAWRARTTVVQRLLEQRLLHTTPGEEQRHQHGYRPLFLRDDAQTPVDLHATSSDSVGAAQLLHTGDARFAQFLTDLAHEGFGFRLDAHGLWTHPDLTAGPSRAQGRAAGRPAGGATPPGVPGGVQMRSFLDDAEPQGEEQQAQLLNVSSSSASMGARGDNSSKHQSNEADAAEAALEARRERNRAMGLPPDFDSGLDLDAPSSLSSPSPAPSASASSPGLAHTSEAHEAQQGEHYVDPYCTSWRRLCAGADEEKILDTLGLAYLPPEARISAGG